MLATPVIGFVVGAGGYLAAQVFADTYSGKMPGPKSFGYFIGTITAATALGLAFMGRKQGYLAESSYLKNLVDSQEKPPKQDLSKLDLTGYVYRGRPIKRAESGRCANCNAAAKITAYDLPVGPRNFCSERCYCMYSGLPIMEPGYYGMEAEQKLSKTECCCGATIDNPCECMLAPEPMQCSAKEPKCPCYAAKSAETVKARVRTMSGRPVSKTLRQMKRDQNITPEAARERKEIRAESCGCSTTCKCRN